MKTSIFSATAELWVSLPKGDHCFHFLWLSENKWRKIFIYIYIFIYSEGRNSSYSSVFIEIMACKIYILVYAQITQFFGDATLWLNRDEYNSCPLE